MGFEFGEGHFDGIQIGAVRRQEQEPRTPFLEDGLGLFAFMAGEIVEDHHVAALKRWSQLGFDIFLEDFSVHRPVDHPRCGQAVMAECGYEGLRSPVAEGCLHLEALAPTRTPPQARHLGRGASFVDKDQPFRALLHPWLAVCRPYTPCPHDISAIGFGRQQRFF